MRFLEIPTAIDKIRNSCRPLVSTLEQMDLIHYSYAHVVLFNFPCALGSQPCYLQFANCAGGVEYFFHRVFQPILATPLLDNKVKAFQYIYE